MSDLQPIRIDLMCVGCGASGNAPHPTATREIVDQLRLDGAEVLDWDSQKSMIQIVTASGPVWVCWYCLSEGAWSPGMPDDEPPYSLTT